MTVAVELGLCADPQAWREVGFLVDSDGVVALGGIRLRIEIGIDPDTAVGLTSWTLCGDGDAASIDGLATRWVAGGGRGSSPVAAIGHPNGVVGIDHVVVNTPDLERTCGAIELATGEPLKRIREAGPMRQGFHRLGELIVEVVTHPGVVHPLAELWGLALNVGDLEALFAAFGPDLMSAPKQAVQPGRMISSFRASAGLGVPVALMTTPVR